MAHRQKPKVYVDRCPYCGKIRPGTFGRRKKQHDYSWRHSHNPRFRRHRKLECEWCGIESPQFRMEFDPAVTGSSGPFRPIWAPHKANLRFDRMMDRNTTPIGKRREKRRPERP